MIVPIPRSGKPNLFYTPNKSNNIDKLIITSGKQYLRQKSRGFCMNSTDFCGLENAIVN